MRYLLLFVFLFTHSFAQASKKVYYKTFNAIDADNAKFNELLQKKFIQKMESMGYQIVELDKDTKTNLRTAKDGDLYLEGFYETSKRINPSIYIQIYDPAKGYLVDALSLEDLSLEGVVLDESEIKETQEERINNLISRLENKIRANPQKKEMQSNIETELLSKDVSQNRDFILKPKTLDQEVKEVFKLFEEQEVVTATRSKTKLKDAPAAIYVITAEQIRQRGYRTLSDALHDLPGFDFQHNYGIYPEIVMQRGLVGEPNRTLVYIDGIPNNNINDGYAAQGSIRFPLANVERIEVVSGPASSLYGANAFNGIINVITKDGESSPGNHVQVMYGSYESNFRNVGRSVDFSSRGSIKGTDKESIYTYSLAAYYYQTEGPNMGGISDLRRAEKNPYKTLDKYNASYAFEYEACGQMCFPDTSSIGYGWSKTYNNSPEKTYNVTARFNMGNLRFETINWQYLQGEGTFASGFEQLDTKERGLETNNYDLRNNARRLGVIMGISTPQGLGGSNWDFSSNTVAVGYLREFSEKLSLDSEMLIRTSAVLNTSHEYVPTKGYDSPEVYYTPQNWDVVKGYSREDYSYQAEEKLQYTHNRNYNTIVGVGIRYDMPQKDYGSVEKYKYTNYSAYIQQYIQPVDKIAITLGYRYDDNTVYSSTRNPRIGIVYKPSDDLTLKFLVGSGFRAPTTKELFSGTTSRKPNPDLQPEKLQSYEMGIGYRFMKKSYFTAQAFYNKVSHLILLTNTTDTVPINGVDPRNGTWYQNQNLGIARIYGTEISNNSEVTKKLVLNTNYTYNKGEYTNLPASLTSSPSTKGFFGDDPVFDFYNEVYQKLTVSPTSSSGNKTVPSTGPMPNIATHKANVGLTYMILIDFSIYLGLSYVDVRRNIGTSPQRTTPGYKFFKVNLRKDNFLYQNMYLSLLINNATNEQFFDPGIRSASGGYYPTMHPLERRNLWFTLGYKF